MENIAVLFEKLLEKYPLDQWRVRRNNYEDHVLDITHPNVNIKISVWYKAIWVGFNPRLFEFGGIKGIMVDNLFISSNDSVGNLFLPIITKYLYDERRARWSEVERDTKYIGDKLSEFIGGE